MTMAAWTRRTSRALADHEGVTAIEYAVIAAGVTGVAIAGYYALFDSLAALLATIVIP
jgi:Flp pilus assembly pilin Flp